MAVFLLNKCTYPDCRKNFPSLSELIYHIEETHIDFSAAVIHEKEQQKLQCMPLSYVLKYSELYVRQPEYFNDGLKKKFSIKIESEYVLPDNDSLLIESEVSDDSWNDDFDGDFINSYSRKNKDDVHNRKDHTCKVKRFYCPVPGCNKRYKNINGIKYHAKNGHEIHKKSPIKPKKMYKCQCGKSYKTAHGLRAHSISHNKEVNMNLYKAGSNSQRMSSQKHIHSVTPYVRTSDVFNNNCIKTEIEEDVLSYSYLEPGTKLGEYTENDQNNNGHFGFFTPPYSYNNPVMNESFSDNVMENSATQSYQFSFTHRKY